MYDFIQTYNRKNSAAGLFIALVFVSIPIDSEFFNLLVPSGLRDAPWLFWGMLAIGGMGTLGFIQQLLRPPLILAAGSQGIRIGFTNHAPAINISPAGCSIKRPGAPDPLVSWDTIRSITVGEVHYTVNNVRKSEPALRLEFDDSVDLSECGDMLAIQSGTSEYFAAVDRQKHTEGVSWSDPPGAGAKANVVLIGAHHFDEDVHQVCDRLRKLADRYGDAHAVERES